MAGIYIHIPFCKKACHYCDFHFSTQLKHKEIFLQALLKEIRLQRSYLNSTELVNTVYLGGGTPSLLSAEEVLLIFNELKTCFQIASTAEITLETNPDDLSQAYLSALKATPVNRLSIGIQSFNDAELRWMNRAHNARQATTSIQLAQQNGFENITVDLIYGTPLLTDEQWQKNLNAVFSSGVKHISAYCLTIEARTVFGAMQKKGQLQSQDEEKSARQFEMMLNEMQKNRFVQYEISNFCKDNNYSKHNSNYWLGETYLGLGPSAHSFDGSSRRWNVSNNNKYIKGLRENKIDFEEEKLSASQKYNEYVMTSLRTMWGVDLDYIEKHFNVDRKVFFLSEASSYLLSEHLMREGKKVLLTTKGKLLADKITSDLFAQEAT